MMCSTIADSRLYWHASLDGDNRDMDECSVDNFMKLFSAEKFEKVYILTLKITYNPTQ